MVERAAAVFLAFALGCTGDPQPLEPSRRPGKVEMAQRVFDTYSKWSVNDALSPECSVYFTACADIFTRRAGADPKDISARNPRSFMTNPDPEWLPGWEQIPSDAGARHVTFGALTYAASMRAYFASCRATAKEVEDQRAAAHALLVSEKAAADKEANVYKRLGGLVRLRQELRKKHPDPVGPRYEVELVLRDAFVSAGRELIYDLRRQRPEDIGALRPAFSADEERDLFCLDSLPTWQDAASIPFQFVKVPVAADRGALLLAKVKAAQDLESKVPLREPTIASVSEGSLPGAEQLYAFDKEVLKTTLFVKKVESDAKTGGLLVELAGKATLKDVIYDCKESDKPSKVGENGKISYPSNCKKRDEARKLTLRLRLAEAPDVPIQPEDQVTFIGKLGKLSQKKAGGTTPVGIQYELEAEGVHVLEIWRQQLLVADYFVQ